VPNYSYDLPENYYFGGGHGTFFTPFGIAGLLVAIILIVCLQRKYVIVPFLLAGILIPQINNLMVVGLNFQAVRLLLLAGLIRVLARREWFPTKLNSLDKVILYSALVNSVTYCILWKEFGAIVNRMGFLFTALGSYFLLRSLIRNKEDLIRVIKVFALLVIVTGAVMLYEHMSQRNLFSLLGAPEFASIRNNRVRAAGPFAHAIIAGTFGVVLIPLFVGLWWYRPYDRLIAGVGIVSSTVMMFSSASSTPVMTFPAGILALSLWPLRKQMRTVRWAIVAMLIGLQLVMKAPIWHLLSRTGGVFGGSGWHRAMLIENFVYHFFDWCLIGTKNNPNWGWSMWDVDNAYVGAGLTGGLLGFILFLAVFVYGYRMIGVARKEAEQSRIGMPA